MVYIEERIKAGKKYYYAKESYRENGNVKTRTLAYLGTNKKEAEKILEEMKKAPKMFTEKDYEKIQNLEKLFKNYRAQLDEESFAQIMNDFAILFTNETNRIEGSTFTIKETRMLLEDNITPAGKNLREVYEQINTKSLFEIHAKKPFKINEKDIILIHSIFTSNIDQRKGYRTRPVRILGSVTKTSPPEHIRSDMKMLISWYKKYSKVLHPLALAALFHAKFEQIHPFADGNGRTGRFIVFVMLQGDMPVLFPNRKDYIDSLESSQNKAINSIDRNDYDAIINYFLRANEYTWKNFFSVR